MKEEYSFLKYFFCYICDFCLRQGDKYSGEYLLRSSFILSIINGNGVLLFTTGLFCINVQNMWPEEVARLSEVLVVHKPEQHDSRH